MLEVWEKKKKHLFNVIEPIHTCVVVFFCVYVDTSLTLSSCLYELYHLEMEDGWKKGLKGWLLLWDLRKLRQILLIILDFTNVLKWTPELIIQRPYIYIYLFKSQLLGQYFLNHWFKSKPFSNNKINIWHIILIPILRHSGTNIYNIWAIMDKENVNSLGHCKSIPECKRKPVMISGAGSFVHLTKSCQK